MDKFNESESSRHYISLLQENITRMASNCNSCKTWLITIVSALFALQLTGDAIKPHLWIAIIPTVLFYFLDAYYLGIEKRFRDIESAFVEKVKNGVDYEGDLYTFCNASKKKLYYFGKGLSSMATWLLYAVMLVTIIVLTIIL